MGTLHAETRERASSGEVSRMRKSGVMPLALIEKGKGTRLLKTSTKELREVLHANHGMPMFSLSIDGDSRPINVIVKEIQRDVLTRHMVHMTLQEVKTSDTVKMAVPIVLEGEPECVRKHESTLSQALDSVEIQARVDAIPESITLDVSTMDVHDKRTIADLVLPAGLTAVTPADTVVAVTKTVKAVEGAPEAAAEEGAEVPTVGETAEAPAGEAAPAESE